MYILEPEILNYIPPKTNFDFSKNLFPLLMEGGHVLYGYPAKGYWCDIGNPQSYLQANADILLNNIVLNLPYDQYAPGIWVGKNTEIDPTARLEAPLIIGHNCYVGPRVSLSEYCVIGDNCRIGEGASLKRTVLWNGAAVGKGAQLRGAVLCSNAQVKAHSAVYEGAIIGDESIVKERCIIKPGSKIWPNKTIEEGTVFKNNLVWGVKSSSNLFSYRGVRGEFNLDISLELALRLGFAFGSLLDPGVKIGVSSDDLTAAKIVKQVLSSGLQLVGQQVYDLGEVTAPITRFAIRHNNLQAGVNISFAEQEELLQISFFNEKGANINKAQEKKIENILAIDDFRFINPRKIKEILPLPGMYSLYFSNLRQQLKTKLSAKLIYSCPASKLSSYFQQLLEELGCQVEKTDFSKLKDVVQQKNADLGIYLDGQGETFILYDEKGNVIKEDKLKVLLAYLLFKEDKNATIVAPVDAPSVLEKLAEKYKGRVIRTKSAPEVMMEDMLKQGSKQFALEFDGVQAVLNILRFLEREQLKLSQLNSAIPSFYLHKDVLECPWEIKGRIIRSLVEDTEENNCTGSLEGVKFTHPEGWALIMPDSEKPLVKIICESSSYELAEEISNFYKGKIQLIMKTQS
jgi:mannose-1-phosphate guanylyltransferase/phosphomannomutase